ncbi:MAG: PilZ domain-containing protein [Thiohalobacterales bacterium]|nr:PilZ domain-containing protein [Thiohalobacterales bacterium]
MAMFRDDNADFSMDSIDTPQSRRVRNTVVVELRGSPRVEVTFPVEIRPRSGEPLLAMITNISRTGLRAEGNRNLVDALFDGEVRLEDHESVVALFSFTVPAADDRDLFVEVHGRTVYARKDSGSYQVGVQFIEFSSGREALFDYLASRGVHH